jgi:soluble lytic murein transglycosylase-like protein
MVVSIKDNNLLGIGIAGIDRINTERFNKSAVNNQNIFSDILRNSLQETAGSTSSGTGLPALTKDQMALLVKNMQTQMNRQLFNIVFNTGEAIKYSASGMLPEYAKEINTSFMEASKNRQVPPKNDANRSSFNLIIEKAARKYEVDPDLIRSVIQTESNYNPQATSSKGAMGLMQLMPETARDLGVKNAFDPEENIMGGTRYLKSLLERYNGKIELTLAAYNWGMGNLERNPRHLPQETVNYISKVNGYYKDLKTSA